MQYLVKELKVVKLMDCRWLKDKRRKLRNLLTMRIKRQHKIKYIMNLENQQSNMVLLLVNLKSTKPNILKELEQRKLYIKNQLQKLNAEIWNSHFQLVPVLDMLR